ncbi:MAG: DNA repair exonuclease, partial [Oscillospiraceae bacterium]|nr:DNA repair exonuclease [Oscillospiraceae bacterium]
MSVKIIHSADFHLDSPFDSLPEKKALERRREQRVLLESLAELAERERADLLLLSGDLFDSSVCYYETCETLLRVLSSIRARIFISPGNHDYYCDRSPYAVMEFPENVHVFTSPVIRSVELPDLGCRVYGAAFTSQSSRSLLRGFAAPDDGMINLMALHGDLTGDRYNFISTHDIESSGLDYLALGHIHAFSGICSAGKTFYAYPGCTEGRGFDETGKKGVIAGSVSKGAAKLRFVPLPGRQYRVVDADVSGSDPASAAAAAITEAMKNDVVRVVLRGG